MENNRYRNINELLNEIESLGDWRDVSQRDKFFKVLSKITVIYYGYEIKNENGEKTRGYYPKEVIEAIVKACKGKFPTEEQIFDKDGHLKQGYPDYSNYLVLVNDALGISVMGERTRIAEIARNDLGIDVYHTPATREEVDEMVQSSKEYYERVVNEEKQNKEELHKTDSTKEVLAERRAEEKEIVDSSLEKVQLTSEIGDIEKQLEELRAKEAELKKVLEDKLNGLEEK